MTVHWVYPHRRVSRAPNVIGWRVADHLARRHEVRVHDWDALYRIRPEPGDILVGHPHPMPRTVLRSSWHSPAWRRRVLVSPFNADLLQASYADPYVRTCDVYCAITGRQWAEVIQYGPFAHWRHKVRQVDLAVDRTDYPFVKHEFNPRGRRRVLYIGRTSWNKNPEFLEEVARAVPEMEFGWVGGGARRLAGFRRHGTMPSYGDAMRRLVGSYDVFVTLGRADANPTTVLEAMAWGLVPVITDTSGYKDEPGVITVPTEDVSAARQALQTLNWCDAADLHAMQRANLTRLDRHFTWARFVSDIAQAVEDPTPGAVVQAPAWRVRVLFSTASLVSPHILDRERLVTHAKRVLARRERGTGTAWTVPEDARPPVVGATS